MPRLGVIELSQLPAFQVLETISTEDILSARMTQLLTEWDANDPPNSAQYDVGNLEFDPIKINQELSTYFELMLRDRVNQAARDVSLADATGGNIDHIASRYPGGMPRITTLNTPGVTADESDSAYKTRIWLSPNTLTQNGVYENYVFFAFTAAQLANTPLRDVQTNVTPGSPNVPIIIMADGTPVSANVDSNGNWLGTFTSFPSPTPTSNQITSVYDYITAPGMARQGMTDVPSVSGPQPIINASLAIRVWLYPGWDEALTMTQLAIALAAQIENQRYLGQSLTRSGIEGALKTSGVFSVMVDSPVAPQHASDPDVLVSVPITGVVAVTSITLAFAGRAGVGPPNPAS